ncbi:hypothetical protein BG005_001562, partial [Podila minutissima]
MKVGDAGEAFFVFETEQEVPDEFATSPLAGPSQDKVEEEIDFLDLAQGNNPPLPSQPDDMGTDHGPDFDDMGSFDEGSPMSNGRLHFAGRDRPSRNTTVEHGGISIYPLDTRLSASRSRFSLSVSLPSSPGLKPHDIMENFQPVEYSRRHKNKGSSKEVGTPSTPSPSNAAEHNEVLTPHQDNVIMDMTGYKTDDSAETDLDSNVASDGANGLRIRTRKKRIVKCQVPSTLSPIAGQDVESERLGKPRLPLTPVQHSQVRSVPIFAKKKRSLSLPNLRECGMWRIIAPPRTNADTASGESDPMDTASANLPSLDVPSSSSSVTTSPPPSNEASQFQHRHRHHRHHHHRQNETGQPHHRHHGHRSRHKDESQAHTPKTPRLNVAVNALSDTELEYQTPRSAKATQDTEWTWGWGSLPVKSDGIDDIAEAGKDNVSHVSIGMPPAPKPVLNEMEVDGVVYRVAISLCPGEHFGQDLVASEALFSSNQISFEEFSKDPLKILNNKSLV